MVSIILVSHNLGQVTRACVESIQRNVRIPYEIIVVDNQSDDETVAVLESLPGIRLFKSDRNLGFPAGSNLGLAAARGDVVWFLNNDTIVPPGSLERMVELLLGDEKIGIVGPVTSRIDGKQQIPVEYAFTPGVPLEDVSVVEEFAAKVAREYAGQTWRMIRLVGFSMLMRKADLDRLGGFDERMGLGTFEDDSMSLKFVAAGYQLLVARDAFIHHIGSASFKAAGGYPPGGEQNQFTASCSAGLTVPDETVINETIRSYVDEKARRVLHAECGAGAYGLLAAENGLYAEALESGEKKARLAESHYQKLTMYTPGQDFTFEGRDFDTVLVEKQYDSENALSLLRSIRPALAADAWVILQVPKITAEAEEIWEAYGETWNEDGYVPLHGRFDGLGFVKAMGEMGFSLIQYERKETKRGFFNRNAFTRHRKTAAPAPGALEFFQEAVFVFRYGR